MMIRCLLVFVSIITTLSLVLVLFVTATPTLASNLYNNILALGSICPGENKYAVSASVGGYNANIRRYT